MSRTVVRWTLGVLAAAVIAVLVQTATQAPKARDDLALVAEDATTLGDQLHSGDLEAARSTTDRMQQHAAAARNHTRGPGWWVGARAPLVGDDVRAVRTVADVADQLARHVVPRVVAISRSVDPVRLRPVGGKVDLTALHAAGPDVVAADRVLRQQSDRVETIRTDRLLPQVAGPVLQIQQQLGQARSLSDRVTRSVRLLPVMLGEDGRRTYLLMSQNNAEIRSGGGIPGAFTTIIADHGRIALGRQSSARTLGGPDSVPLALTAEERRIFGVNMGRYAQDTTLTPDFPRSAELVSMMWRRTHGVRVDGVLSVDPVALSYLLRGTGPAGRTPDGRPLTAANAVTALLSTAYADLPDSHAQDDYFAATSRAVFHAVVTGRGRPDVVLAQLARGVQERRVLLWSDHAEEQRVLAPTRLGGRLARAASQPPDVGVFLNDGGESKLDYYFEHRVDVVPTSCRAGRQHLRVRVRLGSRLRPGQPLPRVVVNDAVGTPRATIRVTLFVYAPVGGSLDRVRYSGREHPVADLSHDGRRLTAVTLDVAPGGRRTLAMDMVTAAGERRAPRVVTTPGVFDDGVGLVGAVAC